MYTSIHIWLITFLFNKFPHFVKTICTSRGGLQSTVHNCSAT